MDDRYLHLTLSLIPSLALLVLTRIGWVFATGDSRDVEILALRHQILVLQRQVERPRFNEADRKILALLSSAVDHTRRHATFLIVKPDTVLRWHRRLVACACRILIRPVNHRVSGIGLAGSVPRSEPPPLVRLILSQLRWLFATSHAPRRRNPRHMELQSAELL